MFIVLKKRNLVYAVAYLIFFIVLVTSIGVSSTSAVFFNESVRKIPVYSVDRADEEEKLIALSFDAAWGADKTQGIIDIMNRNEATGTFFLVGFWLDKYGEETKAIANAGFEIGNHSKNHLNMPRLDKDEIVSEIKYVNDKVNELTNIKPKYFRAPFGDYDNKLMTVLEDMDMVGVQWSIDSLDWKGLSADEIVNRVVPKAKNGDIVLFHNNSDHILDALPLVLKGLKEKGFKFVKMSDLVASENYSVDSRGVQHKL